MLCSKRGGILLLFISGAFLGGIIGASVMACMNSASKTDTDMEK